MTTAVSKAVFITGGSGLLAVNWAAELRRDRLVHLALHRRIITLAGAEAIRVALEPVAEVTAVLASLEPELVVHAAGLTSVERCQAEPELAHHVNVVLAGNVARAAGEAGIPLVHISTDHLFDGSVVLAGESEPPRPLNVYGETKARAEDVVLASHPGALVVRTNFYGWGTTYRASFSDLVLKTLRRGERVTLFTDVHYNPIHVEAQRRAVFDLVSTGVSGIVHVVGDERLSKYEFGVRLAEHFGLDPNLISAGRIADREGLVRRPGEMSLSNERARSLLGRSLGDIDAHLALLAQQERSGLALELGVL